MDAFISQSHQKYWKFVTNRLQNHGSAEAGDIQHRHAHITPMLNVAGLGRSTIFQLVRDGFSIFLVELRDKCINRSLHMTGHSQVASILQESGTTLH